MTQNQTILEYLQANGSGTKQDFLRDCGVWNSGARIQELREEGFGIETVMEPNADGRGKHARYLYVETQTTLFI